MIQRPPCGATPPGPAGPSAGRDAADHMESLLGRFRARGSVLVAFSGGVDSALVAALAHRALPGRSLAVTAAAETLAGRELEHARGLARAIGIAHQTVTYSELDAPDFVANPSWRCYVCQGLRMDRMLDLAARRGFAVVADGTNASDPGPDRPGLRAVRERGVWSPLLEAGLGKAAVRELARALGLSVWDRPAEACLSSRIPHGQVVSLGKLRRIERAEGVLHDRGYRVVRVRHGEAADAAGGATARVEVGADEVGRLRREWAAVEPALRAAGFAAVALDPRGYRRGGADEAANEVSAAAPGPAAPGACS